MPSLRTNTFLCLGLLALPAAILAWLGFRAMEPLEREYERTIRDELQRRAEQWAAQVPARVDAWLAEQHAALLTIAAQLAVDLPVQGPSCLARLERQHGIALAVIAASGESVVPAGPRDLRCAELAEWSLFAAITSVESGASGQPSTAWQQLESPALRARALAQAFAAAPESLAAELPELTAADLATAGPAVVEALVRSAAGRAWLQARRQDLWLVPATEVARLRWWEALAGSAAELVSQRLRAAAEVAAAPAPLGAALPAGATLRAWFDEAAVVAALGLEDEVVSIRCARAASPSPALADAAGCARCAVATALGPVAATIVHRAWPQLQEAHRRRRWLTGLGVASLTAVIGLGIALVRRALLQEAAARELRDRFFANASHDLKTPLTSLRLHAEMLAEPDLDDSTRSRYHGVVAAEGARMSALVEDLLDVAALQAGRRRIEPEPLDLAGHARAIAASWQPLFARDGVELRCRAAGDVPAMGDPVAVGRILANLLQNALRHGRPARDGGGSVVEVQAGPGPSITVRDNGPGVPAALRERLFERFVRGNRSGDGLGVGLALSRELAVACGGSLRLVEDGVTTFVLQLPAVPAAADA